MEYQSKFAAFQRVHQQQHASNPIESAQFQLKFQEQYLNAIKAVKDANPMMPNSSVFFLIDEQLIESNRTLYASLATYVQDAIVIPPPEAPPTSLHQPLPTAKGFAQRYGAEYTPLKSLRLPPQTPEAHSLRVPAKPPSPPKKNRVLLRLPPSQASTKVSEPPSPSKENNWGDSEDIALVKKCEFLSAQLLEQKTKNKTEKEAYEMQIQELKNEYAAEIRDVKEAQEMRRHKMLQIIAKAESLVALPKFDESK